MWRKINNLADYYILNLVRLVNAIIFVAFVLYFARWITGIDIGTVFVLIGTITSVFYKSEKNFLLIIAKKIMEFGWGLSFLLFSSSVLFLWNTRSSYANHLKLKVK